MGNYRMLTDFALLNILQNELNQITSIKSEIESFGYTLSFQQVDFLDLLKSLIKIYEDEVGAKKSHE